jgi:hypothetical protein
MADTGPRAVDPGELQACSIDVWYPTLRRVSIKSEIIPLPDDFVRYLLEDSEGIFLPPASGQDESAGWSSDDESADDADGPDPPRDFGFEVGPLFAQIDAAIAKLGGAAFPKLNWSSPRDSAWMLGGSARCVNASDVVALLKCSQHIAHDLTTHGAVLAPRAPDGAATVAAGATGGAHPGGGWVLALRSWCNLHPGGEFRCFAHGERVFAISQRDRFTRYAHLEAERAELCKKIRAFWRDVSRAAAPRGGHVGPAGRPLAVDVYMDSSRRLHVIDLSPFSEAVTDPLLFGWDELERLAAAAHSAASDEPLSDEQLPELRLVGADVAAVAPSPKLYAGVPFEMQPHTAPLDPPEAGAGGALEADARGDRNAEEAQPPAGAAADVASAVELVRQALRLDDESGDGTPQPVDQPPRAAE